MRKSIAVAATAGALLFGGAGVAHATVAPAPAPASTTATLAQDNDNNQGSDKSGLWGLLACSVWGDSQDSSVATTFTTPRVPPVRQVPGPSAHKS
ncbi:hypothetical protein [Mycolicibacterium pallens]|uniref:hypothetical protein n=1 Tax=Mycolicibacterium pallens TaxID=370524 RepID=UPI000A54C941|nr:hypothetical protein [Mycolicibacterium pallens]